MTYDKGLKKNKFKMGDRVKALPSLVDWHSSHLVWSYARVVEGEHREKDERDITEESLPILYFWIWCKLFNRMPRGVVTGFGEEDDKDGEKSGIRCVWVEFHIFTEFGKVEYSTYVEEKDLVAVKKKVNKSIK